MDIVRVNCPHCVKELEVNAEFAGEKTRCPFCNGSLVLSEAMLSVEPVTVHKDCPFCGEQVLESAKKCKHCGEFIDSSGESPLPENVLWAGHPAFLCYSLPFFCGIVLLPVGIGLIIIAVVLIKMNTTKYLISNRKIRMESGVFTKEIHEIRLKDIKTISLRKEFQDSLRGTGTIIIIPAGTSGQKLALCGISNPERINSIINGARDKII